MPCAVTCVEAFDGEFSVMGICPALLLHRFLRLQSFNARARGQGEWIVKEQERVDMKETISYAAEVGCPNYNLDL